MNLGDTNSKTEHRLAFVALTAVISAFLGGLTALVGMLLFGAYPELSQTADYSGVIQFLHDWQTLIGAMLVLTAASITFWAIREQTRAHENANMAERVAAQRVAIVALPSALSEISTYAEQHWKIFSSLARSAKLGYDTNLRPSGLMSPRENSLRRIREVARHPGEGKERIIDLIIALSRKVQYHEARVRTVNSDDQKLTTHEIFIHLGTVAEIQAIVDELFDYFRESYIDQVVTTEEIIYAATLLCDRQTVVPDGLKLLTEGLDRRGNHGIRAYFKAKR